MPASSTGSYTVSWGAVTGASSYALEEQVNGIWTGVYSGSGRSKVFSKSGNGTFGYRVRASNAGGDGPWSASDSVTVVHIPAVPATPRVSYTGPNYKAVVSVSWSSMTFATRYELEQTHPQDGVEVVYNGAGTSWSRLVLASGTVKYRVRACSSADCSAYSNYGVATLDSGFGGGALSAPAASGTSSAPPAQSDTPDGDEDMPAPAATEDPLPAASTSDSAANGGQP